MTDIDRAADIEVSRGFAQVTVRIPLTGHISQEWISRFGSLAHKWLAHSENENALHRHDEDVIKAQDLPDDWSWVIIRLPAAVDRAIVQSVLNAARDTIAETDAAEQAPQAAETEATAREWWGQPARIATSR
jgi:hypothetical protein